jgi:hypothetical protein
MVNREVSGTGPFKSPQKHLVHALFLAASGGRREKRGMWGHPTPRQGDPAPLQFALMGNCPFSCRPRRQKGRKRVIGDTPHLGRETLIGVNVSGIVKGGSPSPGVWGCAPLFFFARAPVAREQRRKKATSYTVMVPSLFTLIVTDFRATIAGPCSTANCLAGSKIAP